MKSLLAKFRISVAMDSRKPLSLSLRQKIASNPSLQRFVNQAEALRALPTTLPVNPSLHASIMFAVRASASMRRPARPPLLSVLAASGAISAAIVVGYWMIHPQAAAQVTASPVGALALVVKRAIAGAVFP